MSIFERLKKLSFPLGEYVIVGSGPLEARGIRKARDIDIAVTKKLLELLKSSKKYKLIKKQGKLYLNDDKIEIIAQLEWSDYKTSVEEAIKSADIIKGFPFLNYSETIKFKKALNREKDLNDIRLLRNYYEKY